MASASPGGCGGDSSGWLPRPRSPLNTTVRPSASSVIVTIDEPRMWPAWSNWAVDAVDGMEVDLELHRPQHRDRALGVVDVVEGFGLRVPGEALLARPRGVLVLQLRAVAQDDRDELGGVGGAVDRSVEAVAHERRQVAAVVEVGVGEDDAGEGGRFGGERVPVARADLPGALEQPAVDEEAAVAGLDEGLRSRHGSDGADERQEHDSGVARGPTRVSAGRAPRVVVRS